MGVLKKIGIFIILISNLICTDQVFQIISLAAKWGFWSDLQMDGVLKKSNTVMSSVLV